MSVNGTLSEHQKAFLKILMDHYDPLKEYLNEIEQSLEADMADDFLTGCHQSPYY